MASGHVDDREPAHPDGYRGFGVILHPEAPVVRPAMFDHIAHLFDKFAGLRAGERRRRPDRSGNATHNFCSESQTYSVCDQSRRGSQTTCASPRMNFTKATTAAALTRTK